MKRLLSIVFLLAVLAVGWFQFRAYSDRADAQARASSIRAVFAANKAAAATLNGMTLRNFPERWQGFLGKLDGIHCDGCPADFRLAWFDYVQSCHRFHPIGRAVAAGIEGLLAARTGSAKLAERADDDLRDNPGDELAKAVRVAIPYCAN